jgi:hypothetical protein
MLARPKQLVVAAVLALSLGVSSVAAARDVTDAERTALTDTVASFDTAMRTNDMERVIGTIPPKVLQTIADTAGVSIDDLKAAVAAQSAEAMQSVTLDSFSMDMEKAEYKELPDGSPYALIPTETVMSVGDNKMKATSETLAILDEGTWYLLRVDDQQQVSILKQVYPGFADVEFTPGTMTAVE